MSQNLMTAALAATAACGLASYARANPPLPFSTGFEAAQGYTSGTQLATNANWTGDGQDPSAFLVTNSVIGGSGAASGSQWVLANAPGFNTLHYQWPVTPVTNFSTLPVMLGSADVKLIPVDSGPVNRTTAATITMCDANADLIGSIALVLDSQNTFGFGLNQMAIQFVNRDGSTAQFDLGVASDFNHYYHLELAINFVTGTFQGSVNGTLLPFVGSTGGATNFHDFDISTDYVIATTGGRYARAGFDNFSIAQVPTPGATALAGIAAGAALRRRRR